MDNGKVIQISIDICRCNNRRGPKGGVCGCGGAIPTNKEQNNISNKEFAFIVKGQRR
jgi:hypothetical protein